MPGLPQRPPWRYNNANHMKDVYPIKLTHDKDCSTSCHCRLPGGSQYRLPQGATRQQAQEIIRKR